MKKLAFFVVAMLPVSAIYAQINNAATQNVAYYNGTTSITGNNGFMYNGTQVSIGTTTYPFRLNVHTSWLNDGLSIVQTSTSSAALHLTSNPAGGHHYALFSTGASGSSGQGGGGRFVLYDYTAAANRLIVDDRGYLGVGLISAYTLTPYVKFHVHNGSIKVSGTDPVHGAPNIFWGGNLSSSVAGEWGLEYNATMGGMNFWRPSGATGGFANNILFLSNANNVGIGTATPTGGKLHVLADNIAFPGAGSGMCVEHRSNTDYDYGLKVRVNRDQTKAFAVINTISNTEVMTIWGTGVINTPKLYAEEVQVVPTALGNPWPDYVFAKNYSLMPLTEVETFYKANNHLPGVPSQCEVQENGINVYEMNAVLLQKIEELTLYMVEQQKQIEALKAANKQQH